jgi:hypothetical protein
VQRKGNKQFGAFELRQTLQLREQLRLEQQNNREKDRFFFKPRTPTV